MRRGLDRRDRNTETKTYVAERLLRLGPGTGAETGTGTEKAAGIFYSTLLYSTYNLYTSLYISESVLMYVCMSSRYLCCISSVYRVMHIGNCIYITPVVVVVVVCSSE